MYETEGVRRQQIFIKRIENIINEYADCERCLTKECKEHKFRGFIGSYESIFLIHYPSSRIFFIFIFKKSLIRHKNINFIR
jgi:hypothetical protein